MNTTRLLSALLLLSLLPSCRTASPRLSGLCPPTLQPMEAPSSAPAPQPRTVSSEAIFIRGATVWTASGPVLSRADVLLRDGRIVAVGEKLEKPAGARVVDGQGKHLTPGLIDPHSHIGVYPAPGLRGTEDGNEMVKPTSPAARTVDAIWPQDPGIPLALAAGVTTAHVVPGSANLMGGEGMIIRLLPGRSAEDLRFPGGPRTMKMACGENPKRIYRDKGGPFTRMGNLARIRKLFQKGREYQRSWKRHQAEVAQWRKRVERVCGKGKGDGPTQPQHQDGQSLLPPKPPDRDLALEAVQGILEGQVEIHMHCYRADEMLHMLGIAREFDFSIKAFHHATEAYKIRDALREHNTAAVTWVNWWGFKAEALDAIPENPALLVSAGALTALHSDSAQVIQRLNQMGALAYFRGRDMGLKLERGDAIRMVTLNAARVLGIDHLTGSIEKGKMADLTLWDGDPLSVYTRAEKVFVEGRQVYDRLAASGRRYSDFELQMVPRPKALTATKPATGPPAVPPPLLGWSTAAPKIRDRASAEPRQQKVVAIVGGRVHTMTGGPPEPATVILRGDRVAAVGQGLKPPPGAEVVQARGLEVTPGLIASETALGLVEISLEKSARDHLPNGKVRPMRADLRTWDALNPASAAIGVTRIEGFTTALIRAFGGLVSGQAAAYDLAGSLPLEMALNGPVAVHANLGLAGSGASGGSRALALMRLRRLLQDARLLKKSRAAVQQRRFRKLSAPHAELAALIPVVERKIPLVVTVHRAADIIAALRLGREQRIRLVLSGVAEGWRVARSIAAARVPVLVEVDRNLPGSFESLGARFDNAARLHRAGVVVGLSALGASHNVRFLRQQAGIAAAWGLPHQVALAAITSVPAAIFGLNSRGTLRPGARANVVLWSGDPLELSSRVRRLYIGGKEIPLRSRQSELRERYRSLEQWRKR